MTDGGGGGNSGSGNSSSSGISDGIVHGDAADVLSRMPDGSARCVVTDPPYGMGIAGRDWDRHMPQVGVWKECVRVMAPGAFAFVMCSARQDKVAKMIGMLADAGLDMAFPPVLWVRASGFSKAAAAGVLKRRYGLGGRGRGSRGGAGTAAAGHDGSYLGYQPRPAVEFALVGMRPTESGRGKAEQYAHNGLGVTWLDDCRIPYANERDAAKIRSGYYVPAGPPAAGRGRMVRVDKERDPRGRFPTNVLCSDGALDDGRLHGPTGVPYSSYFDLGAWAESRLTAAVTAPRTSPTEKNGGVVGAVAPEATAASPRNQDIPYNRNARKRANNHPAVKPVELFAYLMHLGSRPGDMVLDPFAGTGTAAVAARMTGRRCVAIEKEARYVEIAMARLVNRPTDTRLDAFV